MRFGGSGSPSSGDLQRERCVRNAENYWKSLLFCIIVNETMKLDELKPVAWFTDTNSNITFDGQIPSRLATRQGTLRNSAIRFANIGKQYTKDI